MNRYIALLRGINISGKNKIPMSELKAAFAELGYQKVVTHLNSGNVVFSTEDTTETVLADEISRMIQECFGLSIPVFVISQEELEKLLEQAPDWWGTDDKEIYDNLIFVIPPACAKTIAEQIGEPSTELEQILPCGNAFFWSFNLKKHAKANWWKKTASPGVGEKLTIRTANTLRKVVRL